MWRWIAKRLLALGGWTPIGEVIPVKKAVIIAAPHTSNWDGIWALVYKVSIGVEISFFAKESLFWFPLGTLLRGLGGIPLHRNQPGTAVHQAADAFAENEQFYFALAPEGTRSLRKHWKSGFYRIAQAADVPIVLGFLDFGRKRLGFTDIMYVTGDVEADLDKIRRFYADIEGRWPEKASPIVFPTK